MKKTSNPKLDWVVRTMSTDIGNWKALYVDGNLIELKNWVKYCGGTVNCPKKWTPKLEALAQKQRKAFEKEKS